MSGDLPTVTFADGNVVPALGLGTYQIGANGATVAEGVRALKHGVDLGMKLIDTAELYGTGHAEQVVGEAVKGVRDEVFLVSKVHPKNASKRGTVEACERSLKHLAVEQIDLYLLHWKSECSLLDTVESLERLKSDGKIAKWGVSNFDVDDMEDLAKLPSGSNVMANQVLYNLLHRGIEYDLTSWCNQRSIPVMAYSPLEEGRLLHHPELRRIADGCGATPAQVAIAFILRTRNIIAIPKSSSVERVTENYRAAKLVLSDDVVAALNKAFPPPMQKVPLELGW
ncbi:MAG: aldo/keto reductase [Mesorhizobium sp.]|nr:MAG: aldo/keto reductase [Mesorhizobium sp.]